MPRTTSKPGEAPHAQRRSRLDGSLLTADGARLDLENDRWTPCPAAALLGWVPRSIGASAEGEPTLDGEKRRWTPCPSGDVRQMKRSPNEGHLDAMRPGPASKTIDRPHVQRRRPLDGSRPEVTQSAEGPWPRPRRATTWGRPYTRLDRSDAARLRAPRRGFLTDTRCQRATGPTAASIERHRGLDQSSKV